jgi:hypothetical protein
VTTLLQVCSIPIHLYRGQLCTQATLVILALYGHSPSQ